jgi:hypothetical protein
MSIDIACSIAAPEREGCQKRDRVYYDLVYILSGDEWQPFKLQTI